MSAFDVSVGDCWNDIPAQQEVESITAVPCSEPHESEVFATFDIDLGSDDWPGDAAVIAAAETGCVERFGEFVGVPYEESVLEVFYFHPTRGLLDHARRPRGRVLGRRPRRSDHRHAGGGRPLTAYHPSGAGL